MSVRLLLRMTAPVVVGSLVLLAAGVLSAWHVHRLQQGVSKAVLDNVSGMRAAEELEILVREVRSQLHQFQRTNDRHYLETAAGLRPEAERWQAEAERWSLTAREREYTARSRAGLRQFFDELDRLTAAGSTGPSPKEFRALVDDLLVKEILEPTHAYLDFNEEEVAQAAADNQSFADRLVLGLLLLGVFGSAAGLVAGVGFARAFRRALVQLSVPVRAAAGQLDAVVGPIRIEAGGGLVELEGALRGIAGRIGEVIERLRKSEREALRAEQLAAVGQMAAGMAHELRNPLTSMKILVQAALEGDGGDSGGPPLTRRDLSVLEEEITRLDGLLQSFLDFARPPALEKRVVDVRPLAEQTVALVAGRAGASGVRVRLDAPATPLRAAVDPGQLRQVLLNLLLNALDAAGPGGSVEAAVEAAPGGGAEVRVADDGRGLPAALGDRIFAPFTTTKETGLGLGLSVCKRIVEAHGGTIAAEPRPGGGAVFTVRLPGEAVMSDE